MRNNDMLTPEILEVHGYRNFGEGEYGGIDLLPPENNDFDGGFSFYKNGDVSFDFSGWMDEERIDASHGQGALRMSFRKIGLTKSDFNRIADAFGLHSLLLDCEGDDVDNGRPITIGSIDPERWKIQEVRTEWTDWTICSKGNIAITLYETTTEVRHLASTLYEGSNDMFVAKAKDLNTAQFNTLCEVFGLNERL